LDKVVGVSVAVGGKAVTGWVDSIRCDGIGFAVTLAGLVVGTYGRCVRRDDTRCSGESSSSDELVTAGGAHPILAGSTSESVMAGGRTETAGGDSVAMDAGGDGAGGVSAAGAVSG
jgi:hypothetical protein